LQDNTDTVAGSVGYSAGFLTVHDGSNQRNLSYLQKIEATGTITDATWNANQNYVYTTTLTGASIGDNVTVNLKDTIMDEIILQSAGLMLNSWVSATNTVKVMIRVTGFITLPVTPNFKISIIK
jgi:hypothetical protein